MISQNRRARLRRTGALAGAAILVASGALTAKAASDVIQPVDFSHNVRDADAPMAGAVFSTGPATATAPVD